MEPQIGRLTKISFSRNSIVGLMLQIRENWNAMEDFVNHLMFIRKDKERTRRGANSIVKACKMCARAEFREVESPLLCY